MITFVFLIIISLVVTLGIVYTTYMMTKSINLTLHEVVKNEFNVKDGQLKKKSKIPQNVQLSKERLNCFGIKEKFQECKKSCTTVSECGSTIELLDRF